MTCMFVVFFVWGLANQSRPGPILSDFFWVWNTFITASEIGSFTNKEETTKQTPPYSCILQFINWKQFLPLRFDLNFSWWNCLSSFYKVTLKLNQNTLFLRSAHFQSTLLETIEFSLSILLHVGKYFISWSVSKLATPLSGGHPLLEHFT